MLHKIRSQIVIRVLGVFAIWLLFPFFSTGQNVDFKASNFKDKKDQLKDILTKMDKADALVEAGFLRLSQDEEHTYSFEQALTLYNDAYQFNPDNAELNFKIGRCMIHSDRQIESLPFLERSIKLDPELNASVYFYLGKANKYSSNIENAEKNFKLSMGKLKGKEEDLYAPQIKKELNECKSAREKMSNPVRVWVENMSALNTPFDDYSASVSADESVIILNSRNPHSTGGTKNLNDDYTADIFISNFENGKWSPPKSMGGNINTSEDDECVALSSDAQRLFLVRNNGDNKDIYLSELHGSEWGKLVELARNRINTEYNESFASFSHDDIKIYFVTDNPYANKGGTDMFFSGRINTRLKEEWGKAFTAGSELNTPNNEACIFFHPDGKTIYFTSQGHNSMGGYDIFKSTRESGRWSSPENLGYPVNTVYDEKYISVSASGKHAYITSNRKEDNKGGYDIYKVTFLGQKKPMSVDNEDQLLASRTSTIHESTLEAPVSIDAKNLTVLKGRILDEFTKEPVSADIEIVDNNKNEIISTFHSNSETGKFLLSLPSGLNYGIAVMAKDYLFYSENFDLPEISDYQLVKKDIYLQNVCIGCKIVLRNVFFDVGKFTIRPASAPELERLFKLLNELPRLKVELSGHTDNTGSEAINQKLSENRAKAVVEYLVKKGISTDRVVYKGYGSTEPVADNNTLEGRQLNRRTEFKIIEN
ncbi:MAG: OmpA family protein [Bacteroidales bacterium]|nr:OmpA family protein [Bacteroidales bacterium]MCF8405809.1 OmpA family protein [Bacteroidales bacterium]